MAHILGRSMLKVSAGITKPFLPLHPTPGTPTLHATPKPNLHDSLNYSVKNVLPPKKKTFREKTLQTQKAL